MRNSQCFYVFAENDVAICPTVLEELDNLKEMPGEKGYAAREAIREILKIKKNDNKLPDNGEFKVIDGAFSIDVPGWDKNKPDNLIIATAKANNAILVTSDISMKIKGESIGVETQIYYNEEIPKEALDYKGYRELILTNSEIQFFYENDFLDVKEILIPNEFLILKNEAGEDAGLAKFNGDFVVPLQYQKIKPFGLTPRNTAQKFALEALLAPSEEIPLVILKGPAGTAKTLLSLSVCLEYVMEKSYYRKAIMLKPPTAFAESLGLLPGTEEEKVTPHLRPFLDNMEVLLAKKEDSLKDIQGKIKYILDKQYISFESMEFMRGRSLANCILCVDESQNTTPHQMLGLLTRTGLESKTIITGDPDQIDGKNTKTNNGLVFAADRMKGSKLCAQLTFSDEDCVRSALARESAIRLAAGK